MQLPTMYFVLREDYDDTNAYIGDFPKSIDKKYQLLKGVPRLANWPVPVDLKFSRNRPEGICLTDWVANAFGWLIASPRLRRILEESGLRDVEYLPIEIKNHKGRLASKDYCIVNFLTLVEGVDRNRSIFEVDEADDEAIFSFEKLVLREDVLLAKPPIFRLREQPRLVIARLDVTEHSRNEGVTGVTFVDIDRYRTYDEDD